jgi:hypothetical protein
VFIREEKGLMLTYLLQVVAGILLHGLSKLFGIQPHIPLPFMTCLLRPGICIFKNIIVIIFYLKIY